MCEFDANMSTASIAIDSVSDCIHVSGFCGKVASGEVGLVVEGTLGALGVGPVLEGTFGVLGVLVGPVVDVGPVLDTGGGVWVTDEQEAMNALGQLGGTGSGIGELEKMTTVGMGRRIEEV